VIDDAAKPGARAPDARSMIPWVTALVAAVAIVVALVQLHATTAGVTVETSRVGATPVTVFRGARSVGPVVLIAHGFAGSQQLMQPFATSLARDGYTAVTFDLPGHGRNPTPLTGNLTREDGATRTLLASMAAVAAAVRGRGDGRLAVLGHSMASDIVVRFAEENPDVAATVAVSMFSPAVTASQPRNLLVVVGDWEGPLKREALRAVGLAIAPTVAREGVTYGDLADGTGRRAAFSPSCEHVGVLYSRASMREAVAWLDATFGVARTEAPYLDARGGLILLLVVGIVLLGYPLSKLLPVVDEAPAPTALGWRRLWMPVVLPAVATPLLLRVLPTHFLPVLVGDYLAVHFAVYGLVTYLCLWRTGLLASARPRPRRAALAVATIAMTLYAVGVFGGAMDLYVTSFAPTAGRIPLIAVLLVGTLSFFTADEWLTRSVGARTAALATKVAFILSLAGAVAMDFGRLFFLVIIVPVVVVFFVVYGLFSAWSFRRTGHPFVGAIAEAIGFAWAIGVTFPLVAG
jgi:pimeloyl-ACP methyl ester carboxylesterase